ncbi:hypothetical protein AB9T88_09940 [Flavobacterium sp. LBUM151]
MNTTISNSTLTASIKHAGAELFSLKNNQNKEYIWEGNPDFWGKHSPVRFPIVGTLKNNTYTFEGKEYQLPRHGFAYVGNYSTAKAPLKIEFSEKNSVLNAEITNYPKFSVEPVAGEKDTFQSKRAGLKFKFNEAKTGFDMIVLGNGQVIPFTKN